MLLWRKQSLIILNKCEVDEKVGDFINEAFTDYAVTNNVDLNFEEYCLTAENEAGEIIGAIKGRAYYNEVHIGDLIIHKKSRGQNIGTKLVTAVEEEFKGKGFTKITLTTFGFQAPEFYKKLGYSLEFVREDEDPKLCKYFYCKTI
jgi:ribosomal protein S18 acetylase RimI-like enzyme